jgi:hypothetical protein
MADILNKIILQMSKEEQRNFKLFALRSHEDESRKDLQLFDYIRKVGEEYQERKALKQLYGKDARPNTFHRLRNRLLQEIGKSVALLHWEKDETVASLHELTLAMHYRRKMQFQIAEYYLRRAERHVERLDLPEILDVVLGEFIALSFELNAINPERYIQKRSENRRRLNQLWEIDNLLALVNHRLRASQNLGKDDVGIMHILGKTVEELSLDPKIMADPKFRFRMYDAVSKILLEQRDYTTLESYLLETYEAFVKADLFNKNNHDVKLQMLTYIINALFKNNKIDESLAYAEHLHSAMEQFGQMLRSKYLFFYYNSLVMNHSVRDDFGQAIKVLESMTQLESIIASPQYHVFIYTNLALLEYGRKQLRQALKHLVKLPLHDSYLATDEGVRLRIEILELAIRLEIKDFETLEYRLQQCKNDYAALLASKTMEKEGRMLRLISQLNQNLFQKRNEKISAEIEDFLAQYPPDDTEFFKYGEFLRAHL